eukprot:4344497-Amphidinium_carterae.1
MVQINLDTGKERQIRPPQGMRPPKGPLLPAGPMIVITRNSEESRSVSRAQTRVALWGTIPTSNVTRTTQALLVEETCKHSRRVWIYAAGQPGTAIDVDDPNNPGQRLKVAVPKHAKVGSKVAIPIPAAGGIG